MVLFGRATSGEGVAAQLATIAQHATDVRLTILLGLLMNLCALVLAVTLYAITREQDPDLAMLALTCRVAESIVGMDVSGTLGLLWLATATDATALDRGRSVRARRIPPEDGRHDGPQARPSSPWAARSSRGSSSAVG